MQLNQLSPDELILDVNNPRFGLANSEGQLGALTYLFENCDIKELWHSIVENGFLPYEPLVAYYDKDEKKYVVVEGNRRLAAVKTLLKPDLILPFSKSSVPPISEKHLASLDNIPVNVITSRDDADEYIGFRHVNGSRNWEPLAKARFGLRLLDKLRESHADLSDKDRVDILARQIGDQPTQITRNLFSFKVLKQAQTQGMLADGFLEKTKSDFSHLYTILSNPDTREYIGLGRDALRAEKILDNPVPEGNRKQFNHLITWLYGAADGSVESLIAQQGTDRPKLLKVIACAPALENLEKTGDFEAAIHIAGIDIEDWLTSVFKLNSSAQKVFEGSSDVVDTLDPEEKTKAKELLKKTIGRLDKIIKLVG